MSNPLMTPSAGLVPAVLDFIRRSAPDAPAADRWPSSEVDQRFDELAARLFAVQARENPPYAALCRSRGISPENLTSWRAMPPVPTAAFQQFLVTRLPPAERLREFRSSGTTGHQPSRNYHGAESLAVYEASLRPWFAEHVLAEVAELEDADLLRPGDKPGFLSLTPPPELVPHSSLVHMFGTAFASFGARDSVFAGRVDARGAWKLDLDRTLFALRKSMCANRPVFLLGTAFNYVQLLDYFEANNLRYRLAEGSRVLETGGYKGRTRELTRSALANLITRHLGIPASRIGTEYGMCELASQAYDRPGSGESRLRFPPWARVIIRSPETGREIPLGAVGLIQVVDLANVASVVAIQTSDLGIAHPDGGFELKGRSVELEPRGCSINVIDTVVP